MAVLALRLAGPMQSWGLQSNFDTRRTDSLPTKSGVVGLIASALGRQRGDSVDDLNALKMGIRVDQPGKDMNDYHLARKQITPGKTDVWVTNRHYLADAAFLVTLESEDEALLKKIDEAIKHPAYPLFLGRRSCPVTLPVTLGVSHEDADTRLRNEPWLASETVKEKMAGTEAKLPIYKEGRSGRAVRKKRDLPVSFSPVHRQFGYSFLSYQGSVNKKTGHEGTEAESSINPEMAGLDKIAQTEHDPMELLED